MKSNENKIYELLNKTTMDEDNYEAIDLTEFEAEKLMQNFQKSLKSEMMDQSLTSSLNVTGDVQNNKSFKSKKYSKKIKLAVALAIVLVMTTPLLSADFRARLQDYAYSLSSALGMGTEEDTYSLNETFTVGDIDVKITDIIMDEETITLNVLYDTSKLMSKNQAKSDFEPKVSLGQVEVSLNGSDYVGFSGGHGSYAELEENIYNSIMTSNFAEKMLLKDNNKVKLRINNIECKLYELYKDNTAPEYNLIPVDKVFELEASREELTGGTITVPNNIVLKTIYGNFNINKVVFHPILPKINISAAKTKDTEDIMLRAEMTSNGKKIIFDETHGESADETENFTLEYNKLDSELSPKELMALDSVDIELYVKKLPKESGRMSQEEIKISEKQSIELK